MYLLDTNHCSRILEADQAVLDRLNALGDSPIATSFVSRGELLYMAYNSARPDDNLWRVHQFLGGISYLGIDDVTIEEYSKLKAALVQHFGPREKAKRRTATSRSLGFDDNDLWIAAVAI